MTIIFFPTMSLTSISFFLFPIFALTLFTFPCSISSVTGVYAGGSAMGECRDYQGRIFTEGQHLLPGPEPCKLCVCKNGHIEGCKDVLCAPPQDCKSGFKQGETCCEFICMDGAGTSAGNERPSDVGI